MQAHPTIGKPRNTLRRLRGINVQRERLDRPHGLADWNGQEQNIQDNWRERYRRPKPLRLKDRSICPIASLPLEILYMIFWYLIPHRRWISIISKRRRDHNSHLNANVPRYALTQTFFNTRLTCKAFYHAASTLYYTHNTIVICNGPWGCTFNPNLYALKKFIAVIPNEHLAMVRTLRIGVYEKKDPYARDKRTKMKNPYHPAFTFDTEGVMMMAKMVNRYFTGLEGVRLYIGQPFWGFSRNERWGWFVRQEGWRKFVRLLLQLPKLNRMNVLENNENLWRNLMEIVEREGLEQKVVIGLKQEADRNLMLRA